MLSASAAIPGVSAAVVFRMCLICLLLDESVPLLCVCDKRSLILRFRSFRVCTSLSSLSNIKPPSDYLLLWPIDWVPASFEEVAVSYYLTDSFLVLKTAVDFRSVLINFNLERLPVVKMLLEFTPLTLKNPIYLSRFGD